MMQICKNFKEKLPTS